MKEERREFSSRDSSFASPYSAFSIRRPRHARAVAALHFVLLLLCAWHVAIVVSFYYANHFYTHDVGHDNYMLYNTWHEGRFFWSIVLDVPHFAQHFTPTHVLLVPFHALFRHMLFLPIAECLAALSGAWAVAWMFDGVARRGRRTRPWGFSPAGLAAGVLYVATPSVGSLLLANHYESFIVALGLWALAALVNGRRALFWTLLVLTLGCKEDVPIYWAGFGLWWGAFGWARSDGAPTSWFGRRAQDGARQSRPRPPRTVFSARRRKASPPRERFLTGTVVFVVSVVWALLALTVMQATAHAAGATAAVYSGRYEWLGATFSERLELVRQYPLLLLIPPLRVWTILLPEVLFLALLAPATLLLLVPGSYFMVLAANPPQEQLWFYYSYPFLPFLYLGVALGLARLARLGAGQSWRRTVRAALVVVPLIASVPLLCLITRTDNKYRVPDRATARQTWIRVALRETIPPTASVTAEYDLLCQLPFRRDIHPLSLTNLDRAEYLVLDQQGLIGDVGFLKIDGVFEIEKIVERVGERLKSGEEKIVLDENGLLILRRTDGNGARPPIRTRDDALKGRKGP